MLQHMRLDGARCICCQQPIKDGEIIAAAPENPTVITTPFAFPPHGHDFKYLSVSKAEQDWRLCRYPPCSTCRGSPKTSFFHVDCINLANSKVKLSPSELIKLRPSRIAWSFPDLQTHGRMGIVELEMQHILNNMKGKLSQELRQMIIDYSSDSPLWRYCAVNAWYSITTLCSRDI